MKRACVVASVMMFGVASKAPAQDAPAKDGVPGQAPAAQPAETLPDAASLFEKHIQAIGGMEALKSERNRVVRATYSIPGRSAEGTMRVLRVSPNRMATYIEIPGIITQETWYSPEGGWSRDSNSGAKRITGDALADLRFQADFLGESNYKSRYREITTVGRERLGEADVFVVLAVPHETKQRKLYFDSTTGLLVGMRISGAAGPDSDLVTEYSNYKKFGAAMHPTRAVTRRGGEEISVVIMTRIETNLSVMPSIDPPDEVKSIK